MKKLFLLAAIAAVMSSCDKSELESAEETIAVLKDRKTEFQIFNDKIKGAKGQGQPAQSGQ